MARIITVTNQKGGVGKTTTAVNLAASLALADQRVLLVDMDPQGNMTSGVGLRGKRAAAGSIYDALTSSDAGDPHGYLLPTAIDGLFAIPADRNLTGAEIELVSVVARESRLKRAIEEVLPPGSTFKLVTAAAALEGGTYEPDSSVSGAARLDLPLTDTDLVNESGGSCGGEQITFTQALQVSCNVSFGEVGMKIGADRIRETAEKFGFGKRAFTDLDDALTRQALSRFPDDPDKPQTALSAIGQFDVAATPLQMAMVTAGIANDGVVMKPYLVDEIKSPKLETLEKTDPERMPDQPAISSSAARDLREMMVAVVDDGTARPAQIPGVDVAGKTGTAQSAPDRPPYAWFVSFAPAETSSVAVAVLVQDAGVSRDQISGSGLGAPIAKAVMEAVIGR